MKAVRNPRHLTRGKRDRSGTKAFSTLAAIAMLIGTGCGFIFPDPLMPGGEDPMAPPIAPDDPDPVLPPDVVVSAEITESGESFRYVYTVTNNTPNDLLIVSLDVPVEAEAIENLSAPEGFEASFDPAFGVVDFLMDAQAVEGGGSVSGFAFDSPLAPGLTGFSALNIDGDEITGASTAPMP